MNRTEQHIGELLQTTVAMSGCAVWGVQVQSGRRRSRVRIFIDKPGGVSISDCERVSRDVGDVLDLEDVVECGYDLEVSSPGLDRVLFSTEQYANHVGETVEVRLSSPFAGRKRIVGQLAGIEHGQALVRVEDQEYVLPIDHIERAKVVPRFDLEFGHKE